MQKKIWKNEKQVWEYGSMGSVEMFFTKNSFR